MSLTTSVHTHQRTGLLLAGALAGGIALGAAAPASAHDVVVGGDPADGETVAEFPDTVTLEFSGIPRDGFNTFALSDADTEEVLYTGEPEINERFLTLDIPDDVESGAGNYRIGFQITSSDGHATRGMTTFTVAGTADPEEAATEPAEDAAAAGTGAGGAGNTEDAGNSADTTDAVDTADTADTADTTETGISGPWVWIIAAVAVLALLAVVIMVIQRGRVSRQLDDHPENN